MTTVNPYYYGLVRQIGPWKTTQQDMLRGQKPYQYTPNEETELPFVMKSANSQLYEQYSSQGLIYDSATAPVITRVAPKTSKLKRAKAVRKQIQIVDPSGNVVIPTDSYFLNRYMGEMRGEVQNDILEADLGEGQNDLQVLLQTPRNSVASMERASTTSRNQMEEDEEAGPEDGPVFENLNVLGDANLDVQEDLNIMGEENVDRGAQLNNPVVNNQIGYIQALEQERIAAAQRFPILELSRQDLERPEDIRQYDQAMEDVQGYNVPQYEVEDTFMPPAYPPSYPSSRRPSRPVNRPR